MKPHIVKMIEGKSKEQVRALAEEAENQGQEILACELDDAADQMPEDRPNGVDDAEFGMTR